MRLHDLDRNVWLRISREIDELCDEIASDEDGVWPSSSCGAIAYECLVRASVMALACAGGAANVKPSALIEREP